MSRSADDGRARPFAEVLDAELESIAESRRLRGQGHRELDGDDPIERAHDAQLAGLAFSGGGIRSATINLGILQGLARLRLLSRFDYLSVNSGGGYIGGWFSAWVRRSGIFEVEDQLRRDACRTPEPPPAGTAAEPPEGPVEKGEVQAGQEVEPAPVAFLRSFSNYLTPKVGALTADTWTMVATYLRNVLLNQLILVLALAALLLAPRLVVLAAVWVGTWEHPAISSVLIGLAVLAIAIGFIGLNLGRILAGSGRPEWKRLKLSSQKAIQVTVVLPVMVATWLGSLWLWYSEADRGFLLYRWFGQKVGWYVPPEVHTWVEIATWAICGALAYSLLWLAAFVVHWLFRRLRRHVESDGALRRMWFWCVVAAVPAGLAGGLLLWVLNHLATNVAVSLNPENMASPWHLLHVSVLRPPAIVLVFLLTAFLHTGLMGRAFPESLREWWSRLGAWMLIYAISWVGVFGIAIFGPMILVFVGAIASAGIATGWVVSTISGVLVGKSTSAGTQEEPPPLWRRLVIAVAPQIFIVGLLALVALGVHALLQPDPDEYAALPAVCQQFWVPGAEGLPLGGTARQIFACHSQRMFAGTEPMPTVLLLLGLSALALLLSWRVDINEFSMHLFYRNRLIRAYLGASNRRRDAQPFTGFDPNDDLPLAFMTPKFRGSERPPSPAAKAGSGEEIPAPRPFDGPYPIHNATLNLVKGQELAWQERKGAAFVFTPLFTGYEVYQGPGMIREEEADAQLAPHGFRPTHGYEQTDHGITLGTAMGISGAAASPNMGAQSTPAMAFLLTVFNVRLGWWLGNPRRRRTWPRMGPSVGLFSLLAELFGSTDERSRYVYLSDGGHFDNSSLYELVRRRCRFIVATDCGGDPDLAFNDLGNIVRKCCTDFGIEISIDTDQIHRDPETGFSRWHTAVATIHYEKVDPGATPGTLIYLKSSLTGDEPADALNYHVQHPEYPHESTADQWFSEAQFESYRKLGEHIALKVLGAGSEEPGDEPLGTRFLHLGETWYPPSSVAAASASQHNPQLDRLLDRLSRDATLTFLTPQLLPEWQALTAGAGAGGGAGSAGRGSAGDAAPAAPPAGSHGMWLPSGETELRAGFYFCCELLRLMESVYLDLDLGSEHDHPDNRGWMNLFRHWAWSGMVRVTWAVTANSFGARFQRFCERFFDLGLGEAVVEEIELPPGGGPAAVADAESQERINFLERRLASEYLASHPDAADRLLVLRLEVREPTVAAGARPAALRFTFGFALAAGQELLYLRVQDHLRRMGWGRRAVRELAARHGIHRLTDAGRDQLPEWSRQHRGEAEVDRFRLLFHAALDETQRG